MDFNEALLYTKAGHVTEADKAANLRTTCPSQVTLRWKIIDVVWTY